MRSVLSRVLPLAQRFVEAGHRVHLVGGVVRDLVLGRDSVDLDLTTDARPAQTKGVVGGWADDVWSQGERFGTIGCRHGADVFEITTYRADAYDPASRKPIVEFGHTLEGDLVRRDFTINAMALDPLDAVLVDPHGGRDDLAARVLRTPGPPDVSFDDDPLRMLRAARFVARFDLTPTDGLLGSMRERVERIDIVSAERIHDELLKLLGGPDPASGLELLDDVGLLARVVPEAVVEPEVLAAIAPRAWWRLAAVLRLVEPEPLRARLQALRSSRADVAAVTCLVAATRSVLEGPPAPADADIRRLAVDAGEHVDGVRTLVRAVDPVRGEALDAAWDDLTGREDLHAEPLLDGAAVQRALDVTPGREVGEALAFLEELRIERGPLPREVQLALLREWWGSQTSR